MIELVGLVAAGSFLGGMLFLHLCQYLMQRNLDQIDKKHEYEYKAMLAKRKICLVCKTPFDDYCNICTDVLKKAEHQNYIIDGPGYWAQDQNGTLQWIEYKAGGMAVYKPIEDELKP